MRIEKKLLLFICVGLSLLLSAGVQPETGYASDATTAQMQGYGYTRLTDIPGVTVVDPANPIQISYEDSLQLKLNPKTSYEASPLFETTLNGQMTSYYLTLVSYNHAGENLWVKAKHAGTYKGRDVDVTFRFIPAPNNLTNTFGGLTFHAPVYADRDAEIPQVSSSLGGNITTLFPSTKGSSYFLGFVYTGYTIKSNDIIEYSWEFTYSDNGEPAEVSGLWMYNRVNAAKLVTPLNAVWEDIYIRNDALIWGKTSNEGVLKIAGSRDPEFVIAEPITSFGRFLHNESTMVQSFQTSEWKKANPGTNPNTGQTSSSVSLVWPLGENDLVRYTEAIPLVVGERNEAAHTEPDYTKLKFNVESKRAYNPTEYRNDTYTLEINVPKGFDIESVKPILLDDFSVDVSDLFEAPEKVSGQKWLIKAKDSTSEAFATTNIRFQVVAKPNASFVFSDYGYDPAEGYMHIEMGENTLFPDSLGISTPTATITTTFKGKETTVKSAITELSESQIKYEGVPNADPVTELTIDPNTDIKTVYPDPSELIKNLTVDTNSPLDEITSIEYKETGAITSGSKSGDVTEVVVVITTAQGVSAEIVVPITVGETNSVLQIEFVNEDGTVDEEKTILIDTLTGTILNLTENTDVTAVLKALEKDGYKITQRPDDEANLIVSSNMTVQYHYAGTVFLATVPDVIDFGTLKFTALDIHVKNPTVTGADLTVRDTRGTSKQAAWEVKARVSKPMTRVGDTTILTNAIHYQYGNEDIELSETDAETIFKKNDGGDYNISNGWNSDGDGIKLSVAGMDAQNTGEYQGEIIWSLEAGP